ncbi:site-specific integrase [Parashewanella spongiae]|uniref:Site-specific integrase n=1 Tax=Parashewanella spongiae TaxID=342950 RepID=A0A3A6TWG5_9GAMM|nr:tyrosine-type recombinase/integrase [Parashewanella spongiae]MCL1077050.1 tyrosine-type recombinase/integrase [Parashewanella spongiae]RJY18736.1 site-specific integrase [Parashewanella spongiae]
MQEVDAIKQLDTVHLIGHLLKRRCSEQMADVWHIGLNLALRISDLLSIRFDDIDGQRLRLTENKTGKRADIPLNRKALERIERIRAQFPCHVYLFQSYRNAQSFRGSPRPLSRRAVSAAFALVGEELGLRLGTHSMRKTRGYLLYQQTKDIGRVMHMLRHSKESVTLRYIGITRAQIDHDFLSLEL